MLQTIPRHARQSALAILTALTVLAALTVAAPAAAQLAPLPPPLPQLVSDGRYDIVLLTQANAASLGDGRRAAEWFRACLTRLAVPAADSLAVIRSQTWDWSAGAVNDPTTLTVLVSRTPRFPIDCGASSEASATAFARGLRVAGDSAYPYDAAITAVNLRRGDVVIVPVDAERVAATRLTMRGIITVSGALLRISVPLDSVAPDASGKVADLEIEVVSPDSTLPHRIGIAWERLRPLWEQALRARARRISADFAAAAVASLATIGRGDAEPAQRLDAQLRLGEDFARAGDVSAARVLLGRAVEEEPCLTLGEAMDPMARGIVQALDHPRDRCRANLTTTVARATLLPGFGQMDGTRRKVFAGAVLAAVVGSLAFSQSTNAEAERLYAQYRSADDPSAVVAAATAAQLYDDAESKRLMGRNLVVVGAAIWAASIVEAALTERRLIHRLERVQGYETNRRISLHPIAAPDRVGVALTFF